MQKYVITKNHCTKSEDFVSKYEQICIFLRICLHLLNKALTEKFIFCAVNGPIFLNFPSY